MVFFYENESDFLFSMNTLLSLRLIETPKHLTKRGTDIIKKGSTNKFVFWLLAIKMALSESLVKTKCDDVVKLLICNRSNHQ